MAKEKYVPYTPNGQTVRPWNFKTWLMRLMTKIFPNSVSYYWHESKHVRVSICRGRILLSLPVNLIPEDEKLISKNRRI